jgi:AcrR family transcriptional regulator
MQKKSTKRNDLNQQAAESTQAKLKKAALEAVNDLGHSEVKVADVISRAEVARGTYYLYFKDRNDILSAVALDFIEGLELCLSKLPVTTDLQKLLTNVMTCYVEYIVENSIAAELTFQLASQDSTVMQSFDLLIEKWAKTAAIAISRTGSTGEDLATLTQLSLPMICMLEGYFRYELRGNNKSITELKKEAEKTASMFVRIWQRAVSR